MSQRASAKHNKVNGQHFSHGPQIHFDHCHFFFAHSSSRLFICISSIAQGSIYFYIKALKLIYFLWNKIYIWILQVHVHGFHACEVLRHHETVTVLQARAKYLNTCVLPLLSTCYHFHHSYKVHKCACLCNLKPKIQPSEWTSLSKTITRHSSVGSKVSAFNCLNTGCFTRFTTHLQHAYFTLSARFLPSFLQP